MVEKAYIYSTNLGKIMIREDGQGITGLSLISEEENKKTGEESDSKERLGYIFEETALLKEAAKQFKEYLEGNRREFTVKLHPIGTGFQEKVWDALRTIPYGETRSYKQIAEQIGNAKASRAVGMANHNNPIMCIVPCHRVIGTNKKLVGYAGGLHLKEQLLNLEKGRT